MKLYYHPGACSLAGHIVLHEGGLPMNIEKVDLKAKTTETGADFTAINPKGYVPALEMDADEEGGGVLTENIAVLSYLGDKAGLIPSGGIARYRALETLAFLSTELHKGFKPFFNPAASDAEKDEAKAQLAKRFDQVEAQMAGDFLLDGGFSVADAYLFVMLFWAKGNALEVPAGLAAYYDRLKQRPGVAAALEMEGVAEKA